MPDEPAAGAPSNDALLGTASYLGPSPARILVVQVYALASSQLLQETLDLFLTREAAEAESREILHEEPDWKDVLRVVPIELDERSVSAN